MGIYRKPVIRNGTIFKKNVHTWNSSRVQKSTCRLQMSTRFWIQNNSPEILLLLFRKPNYGPFPHKWISQYFHFSFRNMESFPRWNADKHSAMICRKTCFNSLHSKFPPLSPATSIRSCLSSWNGEFRKRFPYIFHYHYHNIISYCLANRLRNNSSCLCLRNNHLSLWCFDCTHTPVPQHNVIALKSTIIINIIIKFISSISNLE